MGRELSPESETLSGDIFMSQKISAEIRYQVLLLLRQGARAQSIATQLRLTKSWVQQCQYRFDLGDLTWLDPTYRSLVTPELALRAVREYEICRNYAQAARVCNISRSDVYRYVQNMAKWGQFKHSCTQNLTHLDSLLSVNPKHSDTWR